MRILVTYGSRYGSTHETARHMVELLAARSHDVELLDAEDATDVEGYDLVVVGSGIYFGRVRRRVSALLDRVARHAPHTPIAIFALGPTLSEATHPDDWKTTRDQLAAVIRRHPGLDVVDSAVFGGVIDPARLGPLAKAAHPVDLRDWNAIEAWTEQLTARARHVAA